jgi:hypothetical protein
MQTVIVIFTPKADKAEALIDALTRDFPRVGMEIPGVLANRLFQLGNDQLVNLVYFDSEKGFKQSESHFIEHLERMAAFAEKATYELAQPVFSTPNFVELTDQMPAVRFMIAETQTA